MANPDLLRALRLQSEVCTEFGSPFNGVMCARLADDLEAGGPAAPLLAPWAEADLKRIIADAAPIRAINAFHELALSGEAPALTAAYPHPDRPVGAEAAWTVAQASVAQHAARLRAFMGHEPQTNEVRRAICLLPGFLTVAAASGLPLRCFELGASAGLNLSWDRFGYRIGEARWGDAASPVQLDTDWQGEPPPLDARVEVIERAACDRRPNDVRDPAQRRRLIACIWPDQFERLARLRAAIELALARDVRVEAADALEWTRARVAPRAGAATVLYHSIFWQYLPAETQAGLAQLAAELGAQASEEAPFAWLRMEPPPRSMASVELWLTLWPGGETRVLAEVQAHAAWVTWRGGA
jgi:hypothetical protein